MSLSGIFGRIVALIGAVTVLLRRREGRAHHPPWAPRR